MHKTRGRIFLKRFMLDYKPFGNSKVEILVFNLEANLREHHIILDELTFYQSLPPVYATLSTELQLEIKQELCNKLHNTSNCWIYS